MKTNRPTISSDKFKIKGQLKASADSIKLLWLPAENDMVPEAAFSADSVSEYIKIYTSSSKCPGLSAIRLAVRKHLSYLGWKIQFARDQKMTKKRYVSPEGEIQYSLLQVCLALQNAKGVPSTIGQDDERENYGTAESLILSPFIETPGAQTGALNYDREVVMVEPYNCPEAVVEYSLLRRKVQNSHIKNAMKAHSLVLNAKKHLSAIGWEFFLQPKGGRKEMRYKSPCGRTFYSLLTACEWCVTEKEFSHSNAYTCKQMKQTSIGGEKVVQLTFKDSSRPSVDMESEGHLHDDLSKKLLTESSSGTSLPKQLVQQGEVHVHGTRTRQRKRKCDSQLLEEIKECQASIRERDHVNAEVSACALQSSKRARQVVVSSSTHQTPRTTVLSWLIDGNVVLPRAKVQYRSKKNGHPMKEGKTTREGIECSCCLKVFTLSKFEAHAGSNYHRPAANIFLEDGRSLLDCQLELNREHNVRKTRSEPHEIKGNQQRTANDSICSVCHYGGELVLCDKCPSSFHTSCLGLKEVPDGDWFCPSCCCRICGLSRLNKNKEKLADDRLLNCGQCEHQYHIGCLRNNGLVKLDYYPEGTWFCNKRCEQIHLGLHNLLGKPIPVGHENLTWTLLKYKKAEDSGQDALDNEHLTESYSKLNIALSVMHECFEPVREPRTRRDLVEDVIFSRW